MISWLTNYDAGEVMHLSTRAVVFTALFAALMGVLAQLAIPLPGGVPFTMQLFGVFLTGALLGGRWGAVAMLVYLLLGAAGAPVFSQGRGGFGMLIGPTGGYLTGFVLGVYVLGKIVEGAERPSYLRLLGGMIPCLVISYALGTLQFSLVMDMPLPAAFMVAVVPFAPFDIIKMAAAAGMVRAVYPALEAEGLWPLLDREAAPED